MQIPCSHLLDGTQCQMSQVRWNQYGCFCQELNCTASSLQSHTPRFALTFNLIFGDKKYDNLRKEYWTDFASASIVKHFVTAFTARAPPSTDHQMLHGRTFCISGFWRVGNEKIWGFISLRPDFSFDRSRDKRVQHNIAVYRCIIYFTNDISTVFWHYFGN